MCGIAGIARFDGQVTSRDVTGVLRMMDAQVHRGPDDWGLLLPEAALRNAENRAVLERRGIDHVRTYAAPAPAVVLGSRRLSVIDRSRRGRMPMGRADGRVWITYNGEIYNARELRTELQRLGYSFESDADTEIILHGYEEWGQEVLSRLRGMFAFAVLDTRELPCLLLARDRVGVKPLYYYQDGDAMIFASEVRALVRSELLPNEQSMQALIRFLQLGSVPQPLTTIKGVLALPPAHLLSAGGHDKTLRRYWDLSKYLQASSVVGANSNDYVARTRSLLEESVRLHLTSDAPLGVFLSGGVDSSSLVALASRFMDKPLTTVAIAFDEQAFDESHYARLIADRYRTNHHDVRLRSNDLFEALPAIFDAMDQPTVDGVNSYFVSRAAKQVGLTAVLSGMGGDELFLGYDHYKRVCRLDWPRRLFAGLPAGVRRGLIRVGIQAGRLTGQGRLDKLSYLENPSDQNSYLLFRGLFTPRQIQELLGISEREFLGVNGNHTDPGSSSSSLHTKESRGSLLDSFVLFEFDHYLNDQLLKDMDFMSMAHSIETRVPYLDHELVEYVVALPAERKAPNHRSKYLLIEAMRDDLPREVRDRPKMGFTFPFQEWLREQAETLAARSSGRSRLNRSAAHDIWSSFQKGQVHWSRPWALAVLDRFESGRTASATI